MKYLYFGNMGNKGINFSEHAHASGDVGILIFTPLQSKRCRPDEFYGRSAELPTWLHCYDHSSLAEMISKVVIEAEKADLVLATGAAEALKLIELKIPFFWFVSGGEISEAPFWLNRESIKYREALQEGEEFIRGIISNHNDVKFAARLLGMSKKIKKICDVPFILPKFKAGARASEGEKRGPPNVFVVGSYCRRVYSGGPVHSKGTEVLIDSLKELKRSVYYPRMQIRLTLDGPDADRFKKDILSLELENVHWLGTLSRHDLAEELLTQRPLVLDQFGERESVLSGIIREGIALGCASVADNVYFPGFAINLGWPVPYIQAGSSREVVASVSKYFSDNTFRDELSSMMHEYRNRYFDSVQFMGYFRELNR